MTRTLQALGSLLSLSVTLLGCSLLRDLSTEQCTQQSDCDKFGDYLCSAERVCVARSSGNGGSSTGGSSTAGTGGSSGGSTSAECTDNAECIEKNDGAPYVCQRGACTSLTLETHCPFVIAGTDEDPTEYLTKAGKPIIFGAYVPIDVASPETHPYTLNYRFALEEFMQGTLGGVGQPARPFVMVMCQSTNPDLDASVGHLVDTLEVPAILGTLPSTELKEVFDLAAASERSVFLLGPLEADSALASLDDQGRMWHVLGPATDLIPAYVPLMQRVETYVRDRIKLVDEQTPLKLAVVHTDLTYSLDMASALENSDVTINGASLLASANEDYYTRIGVPVKGVASPDVTAVTNQLAPDGAVDIVISFGGAEFIDSVLPKIQEGKTVSESPFYVLSPRQAFDQTLTSIDYYVPAERGFLDLITAGVNYASVEDSTLYDQYLSAIKARFPGQSGLESRENLYDAAYFMLYALAAASLVSESFDGDDVVTGMKALVEGATEATVGPGKSGEMFSKVLTTLKTGGKVSLVGTLGPPDFNPLTGARNSPGSVWCLEKPDVRFDVLRLQPGTPATLSLSDGDTFCFPDFVP